MNERTVANRALEKLRFQTGIVGRVTGAQNSLSESQAPEAVVSFNRSNAELIAHLPNKPIDSRTMLELLEVAKGQGNLVIGDYINDDDAQRFRESDINYLDNVGNAYLNVAPLYVLIQGRKPQDNLSINKAAKLFTETGLRVIFALLVREDLLNASYRKIADQAGVSMGTIGWVLRELKNQGFIATRKSRHAWIQRNKLVKLWVEEYPSLRIKFSVGCYYTQDVNWWKHCHLSQYGGVLGGDVSAIALAMDFHPTKAEVFIDKHRHNDLIRDLDLIAAKEIERLGSKVAEQGLAKIEIMNKFWGEDLASKVASQVDNMADQQNKTGQQNKMDQRKVHPLLTYASLMDSWDPKSRELAANLAREFL